MVDEQNEATGLEGLELPKSEKKKKKKKKKKNRRKYSSGLEEIQRADRALTNIEKHVARAVFESLKTWEGGSKSSARKKKDGGLVDATKNSAKAYARYAKMISDMPYLGIGRVGKGSYIDDLFGY